MKLRSRIKEENEVKKYKPEDINLAMEITFLGGHRLNSVFNTYRIVSKNDNEEFYDVLNEKNVLEEFESNINNLNIGQRYFDIMGSSDIVLVKSYDITRKKYYTVEEIMEAVGAVHPDMYFENAKKEFMLVKK